MKCEALRIKPNTYYRWIKREEARRFKRISQGVEVSEYKIRRLMRENGFYPVTTTRYKPCHNGKTDGKYKENLVKQPIGLRRRMYS